MGDGGNTPDPAAIDTDGPDADSPGWFRRPTIRSIRQRGQEKASLRSDWDDRDNEETRLPQSEGVHLAGLVLVEAFTPSTVSRLYRALRDWPRRSGQVSDDALEHLERSRAGAHGGWQNLGVVRPPGEFVMGDGFNDSSLPEGIDAAWLNVSYVTPALAMVVATFTISEASGDLSNILRRDYYSDYSRLDLRVHGRFGKIRGRIPWARPARYATSQQLIRPEDQKRAACNALIDRFENACGGWFFGRFPGRFSSCDLGDRPVIRFLLTQEHAPFTDRFAPFRAVQLDFAHPLWQTPEGGGWWMREGLWPYDKSRPIMTLAARRDDVARSPGGGERGDSNWFITQRFGTDDFGLATRHALGSLIAVYSERLARMRDQSAGSRFLPKRPVAKARALDAYLTGDGLDAATIISDVADLTGDPASFGYGVLDFVENQGYLSDAEQAKEPLEFVPLLCDNVRRRAERLERDTTATTGNLRASANLRQAIANTRLQRMTVGLAVAAAVIALSSLIVAAH